MSPSAVFIVPVGPGRERTFGRFCLFARAHAPEFEIVPYFDSQGEGCGVARARLWSQVRGQYDIVASLDDDCEVGCEFSARIFEAMERFPHTNVFTTRLQQFRSRDVFGARMQIEEDGGVFMHHVTFDADNPPDPWVSVDWALGGCTILTRQAHDALEPRELPISEDIEWYGQARAADLGNCVSVRDVSVTHNIVDNPRVAGFRSVDNMLQSAKIIWDHHRLSIITGPEVWRWHCGVRDEDDQAMLMRRWEMLRDAAS
jgi:hypothetical protein